jgi:hypothetical protein
MVAIKNDTQQKNNSQKADSMVPSKRMAGNYMTMPITPLCLEELKYRFQNNEATCLFI